MKEASFPLRDHAASMQSQNESPEDLEIDRELDEDVQEEEPDLEQRESSHTLTTSQLGKALETAATLASLIIFSIFGALARIGLQRLATYDGQSVFPIAVAQAVGCAIMGLVVRNRVLIERL